MCPYPYHISGAPITIVARVEDELIVWSEKKTIIKQVYPVKDFRNPFLSIVQGPVAENKTKPTGGEIIAMVR